MNDETNRVHAALASALRAIDAVCRHLDIPYWLDGGTLLGAVRHQGFIPWDDDVDLCMLRDGFERFIASAPDMLGPSYSVQTPANDPQIAVSAKVYLNGTHTTDPYAAEHGLPGTKHDGLFVDIVVLDPLARWRPVRRAERVLSGLVGGRPWALAMSRSPKLNSFRQRCRWAFVARTPSVVVAALRHVLLRRARRRSPDLLGPRADGLHRARVFPNQVIFPLGEVNFEGLRARAPGDPHAYLSEQYGSDYMTPPPEADRRTHSPHVVFDDDLALGR